tara:strand:- start:131 stop:391 length:261 start_codon:yes stop_codon:yes gene_type:complete
MEAPSLFFKSRKVPGTFPSWTVRDLSKKGIVMVEEIRIYDASGKLKKIISAAKASKIFSDSLTKPAVYKYRPKRLIKPPTPPENVY